MYRHVIARIYAIVQIPFPITPYVNIMQQGIVAEKGLMGMRKAY
jgi:hypothetical protein